MQFLYNYAAAIDKILTDSVSHGSSAITELLVNLTRKSSVEVAPTTLANFPPVTVSFNL